MTLGWFWTAWFYIKKLEKKGSTDQQGIMNSYTTSSLDCHDFLKEIKSVVQKRRQCHKALT